jgi:uncharacterized protein
MNAAAHALPRALPAETMAARAAAIDWEQVARDLDNEGHARIERLLTDGECRELAGLYEENEYFRSRVVMARHGFGRGEYSYFAYPLPAHVAVVRSTLYPYLAPIANRWYESLGIPVGFPDALDAFLARCAAAGQSQPTPLLLQYGPGDYNCLHQDLYGEHVFPLQATVLLSARGQEFTGGEFVLTEQRPRRQSRAHVVSLERGDAVVFAVRERPMQGTRGAYRVNVRHGVSLVRSGRRRTLGVIFHDAN